MLFFKHKIIKEIYIRCLTNIVLLYEKIFLFFCYMVLKKIKMVEGRKSPTMSQLNPPPSKKNLKHISRSIEVSLTRIDRKSVCLLCFNFVLNLFFYIVTQDIISGKPHRGVVSLFTWERN